MDFEAILERAGLTEEQKQEYREINERIEQHRISAKMPDYCAVGMNRCVSCGWIGKYKVSGCPSCNQSFVE